MRTIDKYTLLPDACCRIKSTALKGVWDGCSASEYFNCCRWFLEYYPCTIIFTRDTGYHSSGWWKNPLYERCFHLSIAFPGGKDKNALEKIISYLFGQDRKWIWIEPPYSPEGKKKDVWHYRLFCDEQWKSILPKGEVYSTQFTERGWKSFSELQASKRKL